MEHEGPLPFSQEAVTASYPDEFIPHHQAPFLISVLTLSAHILLGLHVCLFPSRVLTNILYVSPICLICLPFLLDFMTLRIVLFG
jgi:hypothetical protein